MERHFGLLSLGRKLSALASGGLDAGPAPHVGHEIADICFAETLMLLIVAGIVTKVAHQE